MDVEIRVIECADSNFRIYLALRPGTSPKRQGSILKIRQKFDMGVEIRVFKCAHSDFRDYSAFRIKMSPKKEGSKFKIIQPHRNFKF